MLMSQAVSIRKDQRIKPKAQPKSIVQVKIPESLQPLLLKEMLSMLREAHKRNIQMQLIYH